MSKLGDLYSDALWGFPSQESFKAWALDVLFRNDDDGDVDIACLASAQDEREALELARDILAKYDPTILSQLEPDASSLRANVYCLFSLVDPPKKITEYEENDPSDYDGEGQCTSDFFMSKRWSEVDLIDCGGFVITYMNDRSLEYYLPAFLMMVISADSVKTDIFDRFYSFCAGEYESDRRKFERIMARLSVVQKQVVRQVLRYGVTQYCVGCDIKRILNDRTKKLIDGAK